MMTMMFMTMMLMTMMLMTMMLMTMFTMPFVNVLRNVSFKIPESQYMVMNVGNYIIPKKTIFIISTTFKPWFSQSKCLTG